MISSPAEKLRHKLLGGVSGILDLPLVQSMKNMVLSGMERVKDLVSSEEFIKTSFPIIKMAIMQLFPEIAPLAALVKGPRRLKDDRCED